MKNLVYPDPDYNLWVMLAHVRRAMVIARQKELKKYKITPRQAAILIAIGAIGEEATPAEISRWLFREPHSISEFLTRMERQGFIMKVKDLDKKNMVRCILTEKGREACNNALKIEAMHKIMATLSKREREQISAGLKKLMSATLKYVDIQKSSNYKFL